MSIQFQATAYTPYNSVDGFRLSLQIATGSSHTFQFSLNTAASWISAAPSFYHPYFSNEWIQKESAGRKEGLERKMDRLLADIRHGNTLQTEEELLTLGKMVGVGPLVRFLENVDADFSKSKAKDRRKLRFYSAVDTLGRLGGDRAVAALSALPDRISGDSALEEVIIALGLTRDAGVFERLASFLEDKRIGVRSAAIIALGQLGDKRAVPFLIAALSDRVDSIRNEAVTPLALLRDPRAAEPFKEILTQAWDRFSDESIQEMLQALGEFGDVSALPVLMKALTTHRRYEADIVKSMGQLVDLPGVSGLSFDLGELMMRALSSSSAVSSLGKRILEQLDVEASLSHENPSVRYIAAAVLAELGRPPSQAALREAALESSWSFVRLCAARALDPVEDVETAEALGRILFMDQEFAEQAARQAVRLIEKTQSGEITKLLLENIRRLPKGKIAEVLVKRGDDRDPAVLAAVVRAMLVDGADIIDSVCKNPEVARAILDELERDPILLRRKDVLERLGRMPLAEVETLIEKIEREEQNLQDEEKRQKEKARLEEKEIARLKIRIKKSIETIGLEISKRLKLGLKPQASVSDQHAGSYATFSPGLGLSPVLSLSLEMRLEMKVSLADHFDLETEGTLESVREMSQTLNFLAHHEVAHVIQDRLGIEPPRVDFEALKHLDSGRAAHYANEILIDKLGLEAARKIYVFDENGPIADAETREAMAVRSLNALMGIIRRHLAADTQAMESEAVARCVAVTREMGLSDIAAELEAHVKAGKNEAEQAEIQSLIDLYRTVFRETELPLEN